MSEGKEYELKFTVDAAALRHLIEHPLLQAAAEKRHNSRLQSTYYDTPEAALRRARISLRVRASNGSTVTQTLKDAGHSLVDRGEWERESESDRPDVEWLRSTPLAHVFADEAVVESLAPRFTVDVSRTVLPVVFGTSVIEGAIDCGMISAGGRFLDISEFELELKSGSGEDVLALARELARDLPLVVSLAAKSERGYAVAERAWGAPTKHLALDLSASMSIEQSFAAIVQACLQLVCRNAALIGPGGEEAVHKTRIALRHLQAGLALFWPVLKSRSAKPLMVDLKWMAQKLGAARDADVFQHGTLDAAAQQSPLPGVATVADYMRDLRHRAHDDLREALASPRWRVLLLDLLSMSMEGVKRGRRAASAARFIKLRLAGDLARLARSTRGWSRFRPEELHEIRKRAKRLRYQLDLTTSLAEVHKKFWLVKELQDQLQILQQTLGEVHDAHAFREQLSQTILRQSAPFGTSEEDWRRVQGAAARLAEPDCRTDELVKRAHKAARRVRDSEAF